MQKNIQWQCKWSPTLGKLESTHQKVWRTKKYTDNTIPTVFMGCYSFNDFIAIWEHKGRKAILWCGSDIPRLINGYWLDEFGQQRVCAREIIEWLAKNCENYVENKVEAEELKSVGIKAKIVPSFLGDVNKFKINFIPGNKVYMSISGNDYGLYGWDLLPELAQNNSQIEFHLYGNTGKPLKGKNIFDHGRVPKNQMNREIRNMQGALRLTQFDGFSEIIAKSVLMGQHPISPFIYYPHTLKDVADILKKKKPNLKGRDYYRKILNRFPWNSKI